MNKLWILACVTFASLSVKAQATIADARNFAIGQTATIKGVVTNGSELGSIRYVQDGTAALPAFGPALNGVLRGDSITVTGILKDYQGLLELDPVSNVVNHGPVTLLAPLPVPLSAINEMIESKLVRVDNVTFTTTGSFASGNSTVQITDGTTTMDIRINGTTNIDGTAIPTGPVSIIALVGQFNANYQLVPRALNDIFAYVPPAREINVTIGGTTYLTGSQYAIGNTAATTVTIQNTGAGNLTVSGAAFSGAQAGDYSTPFTNTVIAGGATSTLAINFAPAGIGSRLAALTINSDDADEAAYVINLYGIGTNNLATEPTANPTNLTFPTNKAYTFSGSFTPSANTENYLVVYTKNGTAVSGAPVDGTTYKRGDVVGNGQVAYVGPAVNFSPRHVIANETYNIAVFSFNGPAGFQNYKTTAPLTGNITSQGQQIANYYNGINHTSTNFLTSLSALINPHTVISYTNYKITLMTQFEVRDTTDGRSLVVCSYTGERKIFNDPFDWTAQGYSREHTYSHSWMPTNPADNPAKPEYSDQHNLYPVNQNQANSPRSNLPMNVITGNVLFTYLEGRTGMNGSQMVYEPRNAQKGNAARAMFYMATAYNGISGNNWKLPVAQDQNILKTWHLADLPDNYEIARNEYIFSQQNNRNPYVDSTQFACYVDFSNMTYLATGCGSLGLNEELLQQNLVVFPVPATTEMYVQVNGTQINNYKIVSLSGQVIEEKANLTSDLLKLNTTDFNTGTYLIEVETPYGKVSRTFIVE
ncbi:endonuclease [Fluviicola taffensis]|uniref:Endonuclease I n=1 Tax=Fluviicola taffensis (strain DSM 16823 / NCIMB 13979 / RW262) TaxID=755732 RepID=F2IGU2_FLUTR|nr:endonuclease [Fluviicola taffensis]AEA44723.1 Endonuclease I [Fluviicola taffensis DSM 16823]